MSNTLTDETIEKGIVENILGVAVSPLNIETAINTIDCWIENKLRTYVCVTSVHGIIESQFDDKLLSIHNNAGLVTPDGMPLVWYMKNKGHVNVDRVYGPDLMLAMLKRAEGKAYTNYFYGASQDSLDALQKNILKKFPSLRIVGSFSPPYRDLTEQEDGKVIQQINESRADIVWVGLSTPKQEKWMAEHRGKLDATVFLGVGAAFDFHAGKTKQAPRYIQRSGFEWVYRLTTEPRRLWKRYIKIVPTFIYLLFCQMTGIKKYSI